MNIKIGKEKISLLLHMDGSNGSTSFSDSSPNNFIITKYGNTQISTTQYKFGSSSAYFDGNGDYLVLEDNDAFNFNSSFDNNPSIPFTIEAWVYPLSLSPTTAAGIISKDTYGSNFSWCIALYSNKIGVYTHNIYGDWEFEATAIVSTNTWQHVALSMDGTTQRLFLDGQLIGTKNAPITNAGSKITIGCFGWNNPASFFNGYIDELRIVKSAAKYTSNFNPSISPFSNRDSSIIITKGGTAKLNQKKYIDLLPNFISKVTLSDGTYSNGIYTRNSGGTTTFDGPYGKTIVWSGSVWYAYDPLYTSGEDPTYSSFDLITWLEEGASTVPTSVLENSLTFLFDPIFYKNQIQNERYQIKLEGCSLPYVNGIYSQTVNPSLINNRPYFLKDDDQSIEIFYDAGGWNIYDLYERDYYFLFNKIDACGTSSCRPNYLDWSTPDGGDAYDNNETPPIISAYQAYNPDSGADLDPVYLEELRNYQLNGIIPTFPSIDVRQQIPGTPFNTRKTEFANNTYRYIKYNNNDDVEHLKKYGKIVYGGLTNGAADSKGKNLQDLVGPLLKLRKNDGSSFNTVADFTFNTFIKLQRPVAHTSPTNYLVREKRGIFAKITGGDHNRDIHIGYRSPYYNINGNNTYKSKFEPFSFVFSFGHGWTSEFGFGNFTLMTDYKYKFGEMYMLSITKQSGEYKIYINGELQTTAMLSFNPCINPTKDNSRSRQTLNTRLNKTPLAPGFLQKNGLVYPNTATSWIPNNVGFNYNFLWFGKSRRGRGSGGLNRIDFKRKRYLNNLDVGVINLYSIALSQSQILEIYNNFRYRYL